MPNHGHQRHYPRAAANEQQWTADSDIPDEVSTNRSAQLQLVARVQLVGEIRRHLAVLEPLDGKREGPCFGGRRERVAALGLISIVGSESDVDVLAGAMSRPVRDVEHQRA